MAVKWNAIGSDKSLIDIREVVQRGLKRATFTFSVTYDAGTIGTRGFQEKQTLDYEGWRPISVMITSVNASTKYIPVAFIQPYGLNPDVNNTFDLYLNAYRATGEAVSNSKVEVTVVFIRSDTGLPYLGQN